MKPTHLQVRMMIDGLKMDYSVGNDVIKMAACEIFVTFCKHHARQGICLKKPGYF